MDFGVAIPFVEHLGFELTVFADGRSELMYDPRPEHLNSFAVTHGGALMTLLDVTMAVAARSVQKEHGCGHHRDENQLHASCARPAHGARASDAPHRHHGIYRRHGV